MTQEKCAELVSSNLTAIYGYAYGKLYDKDKAEDLSQEIVLELLASSGRLKNDNAFWGFAWKIAENTFRKFIRREQLIQQNQVLQTESMETIAAGFTYEPEDAEEQAEQIYRLRRELSLLGKVHREVCVAYYVENRSCSAVAEKLSISVEMVKQHLFKARRLLKEGLEMERKLGEKSYNPGIFRLNFWGNWNHYGNRFNKKLPGAILLAAYEQPMTMEGLSLELGVAVPYLEEELNDLEAAGLVVKEGKKYRTNIVIITREYEEAFAKETNAMYTDVSETVWKQVKELLPQIRALDFYGAEYDDNRLLFGILNLAFVAAYERIPTGVPHKLALGGEGWLFGYDNNYENMKFLGVVTKANNQTDTAWFSALNYTVLSQVQRYDHSNFMQKLEAMCDAVLEKEPDKTNDTLPWLMEEGYIMVKEGKLSANFPVFTEAVYQQLLKLLAEPIETVTELMKNICEKAEKMLVKATPAPVKEQCSDIAGLHHRMEVVAVLMEELINTGKLIVPEEKTPLGVFGVKVE